MAHVKRCYVFLFLFCLLGNAECRYACVYADGLSHALAPGSAFQSPGAKKEAKVLPLDKLQQTLREDEPVEYPLKDVPKESFKNILVFGMVDKIKFADPKLGEEMIALWPLVAALNRTYPQAHIYVATPFPDIFFARQFGDKVTPVPLTAADITSWEYAVPEWEGHTVDRLIGTDSRTMLARFVREKRIDAVFDLSYYFRFLMDHPLEEASRGGMPYIFRIESPVRCASVQGPFLWKDPVITEYADRYGKRRLVAGMSETMKKTAPGKVFIPAGLWLMAVEQCRNLGLDIDAATLPYLHLTVPESAGAMAMVKELYHQNYPGGVFDPSRKIIIINVYAVTQQRLLSEMDWALIIRALILNAGDAYILFTRGGRMDADTAYVDRIMNVLQGLLPVPKRTCLIMPRVDIYPYINDMLGIASGVLSLDTGMSHLSSGVYNVPTAVITTPMIWHWLPPRENVYPISVDIYSSVRDRTAALLPQVVTFAEQIKNTPEPPAAQAAKAAIASPTERMKMDQELFERAVRLEDVERQIRSAIESHIRVLGLTNYFASLTVPDEGLVPPILFVDSTVQTGVGIPRFSAKLFVPDAGHTYLFVDLASLDKGVGPDGKALYSIKPHVLMYDILHEIVGHRFAGYLFQCFFIERRLAAAGDERKELQLKAEEEMVARFMLYLSLYRLHQLGAVQLDEHTQRRFKHYVKITDIETLVNRITRLVGVMAQNECLSTFRYTALLKDKTVVEDIKGRLRDEYIPVMLELFGMSGMYERGVPRKADPAVFDIPHDVERSS